MEFYFAMSGPLHWQKLAENQLEAASFSIPYTSATGQLLQQNMNGLLEPIQLYRFICPEAAAPLVARTLKWNVQSTAKDRVNGLGILALRKMLGLKEYKPADAGALDPRGPVLPVSLDHIQIVPIGYKEDALGIIGPTGSYQEKI